MNVISRGLKISLQALGCTAVQLENAGNRGSTGVYYEGIRMSAGGNSGVAPDGTLVQQSDDRAELPAVERASSIGSEGGPHGELQAAGRAFFGVAYFCHTDAECAVFVTGFPRTRAADGERL